jgi:hypothetical protein
MKRIIFIYIAVLVFLTGCEVPSWETRDIFSNMDIYGDWLLCGEDGTVIADGEFTELRIIPPNSFEVFKGSEFFYSGRISAHEIDQISCNISFYRISIGYSDEKVEEGLITTSFLSFSYMALMDELLYFSYPPGSSIYGLTIMEYYFKRKE